MHSVRHTVPHWKSRLSTVSSFTVPVPRCWINAMSSGWMMPLHSPKVWKCSLMYEIELLQAEANIPFSYLEFYFITGTFECNVIHAVSENSFSFLTLHLFLLSCSMCPTSLQLKPVDLSFWLSSDILFCKKILGLVSLLAANVTLPRFFNRFGGHSLLAVRIQLPPDRLCHNWFWHSLIVVMPNAHEGFRCDETFLACLLGMQVPRHTDISCPSLSNSPTHPKARSEHSTIFFSFFS